MKSIGIIAEYNPFHNGHLYHLSKIKELYPDHTIVLVMSGNFTERGDVSIIDKWKKTEIAKKAGIDLIVELPFPFATQSADYFSYGAITLLENLKVEKVIFGSESDNIEDLNLIAETQLNNEDFDKLVKIYSKFGHNYPTALSLALQDLTGKIITTPNDLLGISYIKAIKQNNYKIIPETIKRTSNYHDTELEEHSSATAIRSALKENKDITNFVPDFTKEYLTNLHFIEDYFPLLKYKIITEQDLSIYQTVDEGLDSSLKKHILEVSTYEELIDKLKSKRYTRNKITRMLLHILCGFTKEKAKQFKEITYIRLLGFSEKGQQYLSKIKKEVEIPIISKINREKDPMLEFELHVNTIYSLTDQNEIELNKKEYRNLMSKGE
jgi:predicted nucleotidyltransferase